MYRLAPGWWWVNQGRSPGHGLQPFHHLSLPVDLSKLINLCGRGTPSSLLTSSFAPGLDRRECEERRGGLCPSIQRLKSTFTWEGSL